MISYEQSQKILAQVADEAILDGDEQVALGDAVGRFLSEDLFAQEATPPFDNSAMDGFAVKLSQLSEAEHKGQEWILVQDLISAGDLQFYRAQQSRVIEIMTGAPLPGAEFDSVIRIEDAESRRDDQDRRWMRILKSPRLGDNIRKRGEDIRPGDLLLRRNSEININRLLSLASQGLSEVNVRRKIHVAVISTGHEVVDFHEKNLKPGQIRNSTGIYLEQSLKSPSVQVTNQGIVPDTALAYRSALMLAFENGADVVVGTGAVSMGVFDFVPQALKDLGAEILFHRCAIRPGKPILFATLGVNGKRRYIFGLPGNPVSTAVGFRFFIKPFLDRVRGIKTARHRRLALVEAIRKPEGLKCFYKAKMVEGGGVDQVVGLSGQSSAMVSPLLQSDAWVILPEAGRVIEKGELVEVARL